jgi:predicted O-methyltransferase YrrM
MKFIQTIKYLKYILVSVNRKGHGIHSPFVFNLVSHVFRNKIDPDIVSNIEKVRKEMISGMRSAERNSTGAGSEIITNISVKVQDTARYSVIPRKYGVLLSNMAAEFGAPYILEVSTSPGVSTLYLASSVNTVVKTIENSPEAIEIAKKNFGVSGLKNIDILTGPPEEVLPVLFENEVKPGLVVITRYQHRNEIVKYFNQIADSSDNKTVIIIDNIHISGETEQAWREIKLNRKVSLTVDIFRMGIVFFRHGINHYDYIIRY